eukprot:scaffold2082_cov110-Skeletonema_dohrnii-CCMP3373.AAC.3
MGKGLIAPHFLRHNVSLLFSREVNGIGGRSTLDGRQRSHGLRTHNVDTNMCLHRCRSGEI